MPKAATASVQQTPPLSRHLGDHDIDQSADEDCSGFDSDNNHHGARNGSNGSRVLKRKRPLIVSYVCIRYFGDFFRMITVLTEPSDVSCVSREKSNVVWFVLMLYSTRSGISNLGIDRAQPSCGWCTRNGQLCEYKERKKPGLRAGYGKELEQRLGMLPFLWAVLPTGIIAHINRKVRENDSVSRSSYRNAYPSESTSFLS